MGRSRVGLLLRALADRPMIEAENRHRTTPEAMESAGFGNQTHKCALVKEATLADDAPAWEVALSMPVGAGLGDPRTGRRCWGTDPVSEAPFIAGKGSNPPPGGLATLRFSVNLLAPVSLHLQGGSSVGPPYDQGYHPMLSAKWYLDRIDYSQDIHTGPKYTERVDAWMNITSEERRAVAIDFSKTAPYQMREYATHNGLGFDIFHSIEFVMGVFVRWGRYNMIPLMSHMEEPRFEDDEVNRLAVQRTIETFSDPSNILFFSFYGASKRFKTILHISRAVGSLSPRHQTIAKWHYLNDLRGHYYRPGVGYDSYISTLSQGYLAALYTGGTGALTSSRPEHVDFQIIDESLASLNDSNPQVRSMVMSQLHERVENEARRQIERDYVPNFDNAWSAVINSMRTFARDSTPIGHPIGVYARQLLGGSTSPSPPSSPSGWATSR